MRAKDLPAFVRGAGPPVAKDAEETTGAGAAAPVEAGETKEGAPAAGDKRPREDGDRAENGDTAPAKKPATEVLRRERAAAAIGMTVDPSRAPAPRAFPPRRVLMAKEQQCLQLPDELTKKKRCERATTRAQSPCAFFAPE